MVLKGEICHLVPREFCVLKWWLNPSCFPVSPCLYFTHGSSALQAISMHRLAMHNYGLLQVRMRQSGPLRTGYKRYQAATRIPKSIRSFCRSSADIYNNMIQTGSNLIQFWLKLGRNVLREPKDDDRSMAGSVHTMVTSGRTHRCMTLARTHARRGAGQGILELLRTLEWTQHTLVPSSITSTCQDNISSNRQLHPPAFMQF